MADDGLPVTAACRVLRVSRSGYYEWRDRPSSPREVADEALGSTIRDVWSGSRETYGVRRVHAELRLGLGTRVGRKRVWRLMRSAGIAGACARKRFRRGKPDAATHPDLVKRQFQADGSNKLWVTDVTQHPTREGWVYCAVVLDVFSRRVVGWSIADHIRAELVVDALDMARWRRKPHGTVVHSDRGSQYVSWLFGHRLREAGLLGSMGAVACAYDNALMESFFSSMQVELLDRCDWNTRAELAQAVFEWIEAFYNPVRRHSAIGYHSPLHYETLPATAASVA
ncbi:IS3 family transposase [Segniliparus rugosus]|nr:IS3 family transposase [Segniliparus rugosus]